MVSVRHLSEAARAGSRASPGLGLPAIDPWRGVFRDTHLEGRYREHRSRSMLHGFLLVLVLMAVMFVAAAPLDLRHLDEHARLVALGGRFVFLAGLVLVAFLALRYPDRIVHLAPATGIFTTAVTTGLALLHAAEFGAPVLVFQFAVLALVFVLLLPNTPTWRVLLALFNLAGIAVVAGAGFGVAPSDEILLSALLVSGVVLAPLVIAHREDRVRREQFGALEQLVHVATTDPLTGAGNRRAFFEAADRAIAQARSRGEPLTVVLLDLDHFKAVNDRYGHAAGDEVLLAVATRIWARMGEGEEFARLGGEEFGLLLPGTAMAEALERAEELRTALAGMRVELPKGEVAVTASVGVSEWRADEPIDATLARADLGMYAAKSAGRNCVCRGTEGRECAHSSTGVV